MRKYIEVFRLSFKMQIIWRFDVMMTMLATFCRIMAGFIVWNVIFENRQTVAGFTLHSMLSYYIVTSILRSIDFSPQISAEVSSLIRDGKFSGHMVTPIDPFMFFTSMAAGETAFHLGFSLIVGAVCAGTFRVNIVLTGDIAHILLAIVMTSLGLMFNACFQYFIGILSFKIVDTIFLRYTLGNIIAFLTGSMVPLSLLPKTALSVLEFVPFTHILFTPAMLLTGQMSIKEGLSGFAVLSVWTIIMLAVTQYAYRHLRVKYDGVGI